MINDASELREMLSNFSAPHIGKFGENLYSFTLSKLNVKHEKMHQDGADFMVENLGRLDVKTRGLGKKTAKIKKRLPNTFYAFVHLNVNKIDLEIEDDQGRRVGDVVCITWSDALECWNATPRVIQKAKSQFREAIKHQQLDLESWIRTNWNLKAKSIYRHGRKNQDGMSKSGWGPETFYESSVTKRKLDIKILMYFDGSEVYEVMAYPIRLRDEIDWKISPKGPAKKLNGIYSFHPLKIDKKFVFENVEQFKATFQSRFLGTIF